MSDYSTVIHLKGTMMAHLRATTEDGGRVFIEVSTGREDGSIHLILDLAQAKEISTKLLEVTGGALRELARATKRKPARKT